MLDGRYVADHLEEVRQALARRSTETAKLLDTAGELFDRRRGLIRETEALQSKRNAANQEMSQLARGGDRALFEARREELRVLSGDIKTLEERLAEVEREVDDRLLAIPNMPDPSVPGGAGADENPVRRQFGEAPSFDFEPKPHWEIGERLGILDFERASKLSGARFSVLKMTRPSLMNEGKSS